MNTDLTRLERENRLLFEIQLEPLQGRAFQPTGFPSLGAATFKVGDGTSLLLESVQSMANRLEMTIWDAARNDVHEELTGLSHVRVTRNGEFLTDTILESHRLNSPYLLENSDKSFFKELQAELGVLATGPINRQTLAKVLFKYDINSLLHGVFLAKKELAGGRLRVARVLSAFIEADDVQVAASGGVKNDHINPSGDTKAGFGNVPFARDEYTAARITLYVNLDLAQIRGYGLGDSAARLLLLLSLYKLRLLTSEGMRLRTRCDLRVINEQIESKVPEGWVLPTREALSQDVGAAVSQCRDEMVLTEVAFDDEFKKAKDRGESSSDQTD